MPMHRSNKAPRTLSSRHNEQWFLKKNDRERNRKKMAKNSKRRNR